MVSKPLEGRDLTRRERSGFAFLIVLLLLLEGGGLATPASAEAQQKEPIKIGALTNGWDPRRPWWGSATG
jgi:hypothetical protein